MWPRAGREGPGPLATGACAWKARLDNSHNAIVLPLFLSPTADVKLRQIGNIRRDSPRWPDRAADYGLSALFKCARGEASDFFKRRYSFQLVGVLLSIVPDVGRCRFTDRARHILRGEREGEGHWIVGLSAVAKAQEAAGFGFPTCTNKLQFALGIGHWTRPSWLVKQNDQIRRLVPGQTMAAGSGGGHSWG